MRKVGVIGRNTVFYNPSTGMLKEVTITKYLYDLDRLLTHSNSLKNCIACIAYNLWGDQDGAMVLGKLAIPGRPTNLDN